MRDPVHRRKVRTCSSFRRLPLLLTGLVLLPACSGWHPTPLRPETAPVIDDRKPVRVKPRNGSAEVLWHPRVVGDSLIGEVGYPPMRSAYAIRDLERMDELGFSRVRTGIAVLVGISVGLVIGVLYSLGSGPG